MKGLSRTIAAVAVLGLVAAACGGDELPEPAELNLIQAGVLTVGSDIPYAPFEFEDETSGELMGFDVELVEAVAEQLGLEVEWVNAGFDTIFTALDGGQFDVVASAVTAYAPEGNPAFDTVQERREIVAFSAAYYESLQSLTTNTEETPDIQTIEDVPAGARIGVQRGTTGQSFAEANLPDAEIVTFRKAPPMFEQLEAGQLVGIINDLPVSLEAIAERPSLSVVQQLETGEDYGFAVQQDNPELVAAIDAALQVLFDDGTYAAIFKKYFPDQELPDFATE